VDTRDELLARGLDTVVDIKKRENQPRRTTRGLRTPVVSAVRFKVGYYNVYFKL
jgi:hypothetical protein